MVTTANVKTLVPGSRCPPKAFFRIGESNVGMDPAINDVPIHAGDVGRRLGILDVDVLARKGPIADDVIMVPANGTNAGKNDSILNPLRFHHLFEPRQQV